MHLTPFHHGPLASWKVIGRAEGWAPCPDFVYPELGDATSLPSSIVTLSDSVVMVFDDIAAFAISIDQKTISIFAVDEDATSDDLDHLLYDHVVPRIIAGHGNPVLHGSALEIDQRIAVFLGDTGAGKSTLAASLHHAGYRLLGDDALIVHSGKDGYSGSSVYPTLRLYPETIAQVLGEGIQTAPMANYSTKRRVQLPTIGRDNPDPLPIGALFFLGDGRDAKDVTKEAIGPGEACMAIMGQSFALDPSQAGPAAKRLEQISGLVEALPCYRLTYPRDFARLKDVHETILSVMRQHSQEPLSVSERVG